MLFRFKNRNQCPHKATLKERWIIVEEVRCVLDKHHVGPHRAMTKDGTEIQWMTQDKIGEFVMENLKE